MRQLPQDGTPGDANFESLLPAAAFKIPADEREERLTFVGPHQLVIDRDQHFVRGLIEIPVRAESEPFCFLEWVNVSAETFVQLNEPNAVGSGTLANPIHPLGIRRPENVRLIERGKTVPLVEPEPGGALSELIRWGITYDERLEAYHLLTLPHRVDDLPPGYETALRRLAARRFVQRSSRNLELNLPTPPDSILQHRLMAIIGPLTSIGHTFTSGAVTEEVAADAEAQMPDVRDAEWGLSVWDLDTETGVFSRTYAADGDVEDAVPSPALIRLAGLLMSEYGSVRLSRGANNRAEMIVEVRVPVTSARAAQLQEDTRLGALIGVASPATTNRQGVTWRATGWNAVPVLRAMLFTLQSLHPGLAELVIGLKPGTLSNLGPKRLAQFKAGADATGRPWNHPEVIKLMRRINREDESARATAREFADD